MGSCNCDALAACAGAAIGGLVALKIISLFKNMKLEIPTDPEKVTQLGVLLCMDLGGIIPGAGGMAHCDNWDWPSDKDPKTSGKCGLKMCNIQGPLLKDVSAPLKGRRFYVEHNNDFWATAAAIDAGTLDTK